ncbi:hypothetical protein ACHAXT_008428 [Thalassiosira profunda]
MTPASIVLLLLALLASAAAAPPASSPKTTYAKVGFVPPASPTLVSPLAPRQSAAGWPSTAKQHQARINHQIATGYGTYTADSPSPTSLFGKKKKGGGGGGGTATKKGKLQIQLLETVPQLGQKGDVIFVASAVFHNQLRGANKARLIGEEEVKQMEAEQEEEQKEMAENARRTKAMLEEAMVENLGGEEQCDDNGDICGVALELKRKAGPEGNLFGGVNPKMVMEALKERYPEGSWDGKQVKLTEVKDMEGKDVKKKDIKHTGEYTMSVSLGKDVDVTFVLSIAAE